MLGSNQPKINVEENMLGRRGWGIMNMKKKKKKASWYWMNGEQGGPGCLCPPRSQGALVMNILPHFFFYTIGSVEQP